MIDEYVLARINALQQELDSLKRIVAQNVEHPGQETRLKGLWKGIQVNDKDFDEAERAVFRNAYNLKR